MSISELLYQQDSEYMEARRDVEEIIRECITERDPRLDDDFCECGKYKNRGYTHCKYCSHS